MEPSGKTEVIHGQESILQALNQLLDSIDFEVRIVASQPVIVQYLDNLQVFQRLRLQKNSKNFSVRLVAAFGETNKFVIRRISPYIEYKAIESLPAGLIMFIRDKTEVLLINFTPSAVNLNKTGAFDTLLQSSHRLIVETMLATFDAWWNQVENNDKMMKEKAHAELLLDVITHDLVNHNQIVAPNLELAQLILDEASEEGIRLSSQEVDDLRQYLESAMRGVERSTSLVDNIRRLEKMYREKYTELRGQDLISAIDSAIATVRNSTKIQKDILYSLNVDSGNVRPMVLADDLLEEIFLNLFSNSIKATEDKQVAIVVDIKEKAIGAIRYWMINVSDNGEGIPDEVKSELFARFYSRAKGTGLGLSIVRALVERYKGRVWVGDRVPNDHTKGARIGIIIRDASAGSKK